ncbi:S1 RNA-binding domain-containing protein, partial [bacterium]|nr:S1 RNA-binding domain-containing protein [bacterium]
YSVGEAGRFGGQSRREIGHGALAERSILAMMPPHEKFPYTVRIVCETLESNGSSSMGSVCSASMALMDAGVPYPKPVAGIAMGLIKEDNRVAILSDILGDEDHLGDMDFKVAGTKDGVTGIQMDIKIEGVTGEIMKQALEQAHQGRQHILNEMAKAISNPRDDLNKNAPRITKKITDFGAFIGVLPNQDGLLHISEIAYERINHVTDVLKEGDIIEVKVLDVDSQGKVRLSRKALLTPPEGYVPPPPREPRQGGDRDRRPMGGRDRGGDRGPRR